MDILLPTVAINTEFFAPMYTGNEHTFSARDDSNKPFISRKAHTKSRGGCSSCKRRRQKCDEEKPSCGRCHRLAFTCEYSLPTSRVTTPASMAVSSNSESALSSPRSSFGGSDGSHEAFLTSLTLLTLSNAKTVAATVQTLLSLSQNCLTASAAEDLSFFVNADFTSAFGSAQLQQMYRLGTIQMGMTRPYLMHSVLAVSSMQKRLAGSSYTQPNAQETTHWQNATQLFRARLAQPSFEGDTEALLATASFMNGLSFASMSTLDPEDAWPLSDPPDALAWLGMLRGPAIMLDQLRKEQSSTDFRNSLAGLADGLINNAEVLRPGVDGVPRAWVELCELTPTATQASNPYHSTVRAICNSMPNNDDKAISTPYFSFIGAMNQKFADLLHAKDHRALLIVAHWYAILNSSDFWWCRTRAFVECKSICMYLEMHGSDQIKSMLEFPAMACGYQLLSDLSLENGPLAMAVPESCALM